MTQQDSCKCIGIARHDPLLLDDREQRFAIEQLLFKTGGHAVTAIYIHILLVALPSWCMRFLVSACHIIGRNMLYQY